LDKEDFFRKELSGLYAEIDLNSLLNKIAAKIRSCLDCEEASIFLYDPQKEELYFETATGEKQDVLKKIVLEKGEGIAGWIARQEQPLIINDCAADARFTSKADRKTDFKTRSIAGVPVRLGNKLLGVLEAVNKINGEFDVDDREALEYISLFVAIPLQNAILFRKVTRETRDKDRLIELAKSISYAVNQDEVFAKLKEIICEIISPHEINVMVKTREKSSLYRLLNNTGETGEIDADKLAVDTTLDSRAAVFPLRAKDRDLGLLEIKAEKKIAEEDLALIRGLTAFVAVLIEKLEMQTRMIEKEKIEKELEIARKIQQSFLLNVPVHLKGLDAAYANIPSSEVGGDYYDIIKLNDWESIFTINDVSGHGIPASLIMSIFRTNFVYRVKKDRNLITTIDYLNDMIADTTDSNHFVTSFTCRLDVERNRLFYLNAGHNSPFILRGEEIILLDKGSMPVGMFPGTSYRIVEMPLEERDFVAMYTDGIVEAENPGGEQYSLERFIRFIKTHRERHVEEIKEAFISELKNFIQNDRFEDDVTFILVKRE
jgi:sigma-B regulation protein RsbU (phosphoserine phosphatase)